MNTDVSLPSSSFAMDGVIKVGIETMSIQTVETSQCFEV